MSEVRAHPGPEGVAAWVRQDDARVDAHKGGGGGEPYRALLEHLAELVGTGEDITSRKQAEATVRAAARKCEEDRAQLEAVFQAMDDIVVVFDMAGQTVFVNKPEGKGLGFPDLSPIAEGVDGAPSGPLAEAVIPSDVPVPLELAHVNGSPVPFGEWPSVRALRGEAVAGLVLKAKNPATDEESWLSFNATPVRNRDGEQILALLVIRDVTGQHRIEEELREADRRKNDFLATLSHELRNPLAPIRNSLFLVERASPGSPRANRALEVIRRQTEQIARLVDDLLDVTRIARGKVVLERERIDLREVVRATCEDHRSMMVKGDVELEMELPLEPVWVCADRTRMVQVVGNLLQNALKFTPAGGRIEARLEVHDRWAEIAIADTGAGIAPADLERVFAPFAQGDQRQVRTPGGLGLGLALVKGLAELQGGVARAYSEGLGTGSEFVVALPILAER